MYPPTAGSQTHTRKPPISPRGDMHTDTHARIPNFPKPSPYVPAEMQGFKGICLPKGAVLDFIIQICYSCALGQFTVY